MASPRWQYNFDERQRQYMRNLFDTILSGDVNRINTLFGPRGSARDDMSTGNAEYYPVLQRIAQDYMNLGGVSPETRALIDAQPASGGFAHSRPERGMGAQAANAVFRQLAQALPQVTSVAGDRQVRMMGMFDDMTPQDYIQQYITNQALQFLDPSTRRETQQYLARANPNMFRAYGMMPSDPIAGQDTIDPTALKERLSQAASALDFNKLSRELAPVLGGAGSEAYSPAKWLQDYLKTSMSGLGGTRAQQQLAGARLQTLEKEAAAKPQEMGQFLTLAENLTNPVFKDRPSAGIIGVRRGTKPISNFMRKGLVRQNPYLT